MKILALDLATETGWAIGRHDLLPDSGAVRLKESDEHRRVAMGNLIAFLDDVIRREKPDLIVKEAPFTMAAMGARFNSQARAEFDYGLHGVLDGMAERWGIQVEAGYAQTIRKHFLGRANLGKRAETKAAVVQRCHLLGLMPKTSKNDNQADSLACWHWGASTFGNRIADKLFLYEERGK